LRPYLSPLHRESTSWRLIYSLDHHGISLNTLYHKCELYAGPGNPVLLVLRDEDHGIFGAFASEAFRVQNGYFGNGSSFLFKVTKGNSPSSSHQNSQNAPSGSINDVGGNPPALAPSDMEVAVYKATGVNDYLILGQSHYIAMGGGEGHFGLWIDQDLYNGHSGHCHTFNNERLSKKAEFVVQSLELWAFDI
ncbi:TLDc domain-containing protein, partial [Chytriomyces sp. MP71]